MGAGAMSAALLARWAKAAEYAKDSETFTFVVVNDIHFFDKRCATWLDKVVEKINGHKADLCLIVGDMTEDGTAEQNAAVHEVLKGLKLPYHVVVGNHDYLPDNTRKPFEAHFPKSLNYRFDHKGLQFVGLDTTLGRAGSKTVIAKETFTWLTGQLKDMDKKRPTVLFTHFPMGWLVPSRPDNAAELLNEFKQYNLQAVFNGHFHSSTERKWGEATVTTNTCCSFHRKNHDLDPRKGYFLCTAKEGKVSREYVQVNEGELENAARKA